VCRALIAYAIDAEKCVGCGACLRACPRGAISGERKQPHLLDAALCQRCGICGAECKSGAIVLTTARS
jgi:NADH-quinone oxidoreductase subunit F